MGPRAVAGGECAKGNHYERQAPPQQTQGMSVPLGFSGGILLRVGVQCHSMRGFDSLPAACLLLAYSSSQPTQPDCCSTAFAAADAIAEHAESVECGMSGCPVMAF
jgi:hypothetical protein